MVEIKVMLPTEDDFRRALQAFRERWPHDGYFDQNERFIVTTVYFEPIVRKGVCSLNPQTGDTHWG